LKDGTLYIVSEVKGERNGTTKRDEGFRKTDQGGRRGGEKFEGEAGGLLKAGSPLVTGKEKGGP